MTTVRSGFEWDDVEPTPSSASTPAPSTRPPPASFVRAAARARSPKGPERMSLRAVREAMHKTQAEVATLLGSEQGEISRIERRDDVRLSTLRRYAIAIGAECEVVFVFPKTGHRITITEPE